MTTFIKKKDIKNNWYIINAENAVAALIKLIQKHGDWQEPNNV